MIMNNKIKNGFLKKNNDGSALIVCIIVLLFVSILATVILYMSGINYRMKKNEYQTKVSFYSGEEYLERMQSNLVIPVSEAMGNAYRMTNSRYVFLPSTNTDPSLSDSDVRRIDFYNNFNDELKDILLNHYGVYGTTPAGAANAISNAGTAPSDSTFVKNIIHNLTSTGPDTGDGVDVTKIYVNDGSIVNYQNYADALSFVDAIAAYDAANGTDHFAPNASNPKDPEYYICVYGEINQGDPVDPDLRRDLNYDEFVKLDVVDPDTGALNGVDSCRVLIKNVCVVCVQNGYRSIISTDIAIQFPPLDWDDGSSVDSTVSWNVYQLIYYINWKKN